MSKKITLLTTILASAHIAGCSTMRNSIFESVEPVSPAVTMIYNFIQPRRTALAPDVSTRLNQAIDVQDRFDYYSASGYRCRILSLNPFRSACNINGEWRELAPILNPKHP